MIPEAAGGVYSSSMRLARLTLALVVALASLAWAAGDRPADEARPRVEHHVRQAEALADHFDAAIRNGCPRFASAAQWQAFLDSEVDRLVLLVAHVEQAWTEAKTTGDDEVRRAAKAPRRRLNETRSLMDKWQACAQNNGSDLDVAPILRRIEREVPRRQVEIELPR